MRNACFICGNRNENVLERHHIVPQRYGGKDTEENTVLLCSNCHTAVEKIYSVKKVEEITEKVSDVQKETATIDSSVEKFTSECIVSDDFKTIHFDDVYQTYKQWCFDRNAPLLTSPIKFRGKLESLTELDIHCDQKFGWCIDSADVTGEQVPDSPRYLTA